MARSGLFRALRRLGRAPRREPGDGWSRRQFIQALGVAATLPAIGGCGDEAGGGRRIAIVGGGMAGLAAAHVMALAGVRADVYEGSMRIGGRMYTQRGLPGDQLVELGGELVDSGHVVIPMLASAFGLELDDLVADTMGLKQDTFLFNGSVIPAATMVDQFAPIAAKMQMSIMTAEAENAAGAAELARIDALSIPQYLEEVGAQPLIKQILELAYLEEYGLEVAEQSAWNLLYLIDSKTPDPFHIFGDSDERFHLHAGNDALPTAIADSLGDQIHLDHRLTAVNAAGDSYELAFATSGGNVTVRADHVVYALPFTKLREVDLADAGLSEEKREAIAELGYGTNAKLMLQFTDRHWQTAHGSSGSVITDVGKLQTLWATSRGQRGTQGILTNFVGGTRGLGIGDGTPESQAQAVLPDIDTVFSGTAAKYVAGSAIRQHWPSYEFTKGSYASYRVGQWRFFGTEGVREGNQHFCGEHCSEDFQGYMEGAAETGAMVGAEVLDDLGVEQPQALKSLLPMIAARPRASYHGEYGRRMKLSQIRRRWLKRG